MVERNTSGSHKRKQQKKKQIKHWSVHFLSQLLPVRLLYYHLSVSSTDSPDVSDTGGWNDDLYKWVRVSITLLPFRNNVWLTFTLLDNSMNPVTSLQNSSVYHLRSDANLGDTRAALLQHPLITHDICTALAELCWHKWMKQLLIFAIFVSGITHVCNSWNIYTVSY